MAEACSTGVVESLEIRRPPDRIPAVCKMIWIKSFRSGSECCSIGAPLEVDWLVDDSVWKALTAMNAFCSTHGFVRVERGMFFVVCLLTASVRISSHAQVQQLIPIEFTNSTAATGIKFVHYKGNNGMAVIREEFGPGVCVADFDGDGFQDIYFVNGRDLYNRGISVRNALYHNNGDGTFTDVTEKAGVPGTGFGLGCVWGDYDNDGYPDLYVTQFGRNVLYHNNGNGTFTDVTDKAGVAGTESGLSFMPAPHSSTMIAMAGLIFMLADTSLAADALLQVRRRAHQLSAECLPWKSRHALPQQWGRNIHECDVKAGIYQPEGKNLSVQAADYDNDGWPDLFVANDGLNAYLYHNEHNGTFNEVARSAAWLSPGAATPWPRCAFPSAINNDGWLDLYISDFQRAPTTFGTMTGKADSTR